jgi:tryptophan synthase alpha chain
LKKQVLPRLFTPAQASVQAKAKLRYCCAPFLAARRMRLQHTFQALAASSRKGLIPFITCGDPHPDCTCAIMHALVEVGASAIELGMPFSDPAADGPVIEKASERAIAKGTTLASVLATLAQFRTRDAATPVVLMGYLNPILQYGRTQFFADAKAAGADALLLVDCPIEESEKMRPELHAHGLQQIFLVAPTSSPARRQRMAAHAEGFLYYVSFAGITGASLLDPSEVSDAVIALKAISKAPVAVGFGVKDAASARAIAEHADAVVVGSALVQHLAASTDSADAQQRALDFLRPIRTALDS